MLVFTDSIDLANGVTETLEIHEVHGVTHERILVSMAVDGGKATLILDPRLGTDTVVLDIDGSAVAFPASATLIDAALERDALGVAIGLASF